MTNIFISYSWSNSDVADQIEKDLGQLQITLIRDVRDISYKSDIQSFMSKIRESDFALVLLSKEYFQSKNCMIEVLHLMKEQEYENKILPIIIGNSDIYTSVGRLQYTKYWEQQKSKLETVISDHKPEIVINELSELKIINSIHGEMNEFLSFVSNLKNLSFKELRDEGYKSILEKIGFKDVSYLVDLLVVSFEQDLNKREILLDDWLEKNNPTTDSYSLRAGISNALGNIERAELNYIKALELSENNYFAMNNYAFMLMGQNRDHDNAKKLLKKAIELSPFLTVARLNLGVLLTSHFEDTEGAVKQYTKIISYDPTEPRSYNNLANILKIRFLNGDDVATEVCTNYIKAISFDPNYIEAKLGYSNFLSLCVKDFKGATDQLNEILEIDAEATSLVEVMKKDIENRIQESISNGNYGRNDKCPCGNGKKFKKCHGA